MNFLRQLSALIFFLSCAALQAAEAKPRQVAYTFSTKRGVMTMREVSRNDKTSRLRVSVPNTFAVGDMTGFLLEVCYKIAVARNVSHFLYLSGSDAEEGPQDIIVGFTNKSKPNIKKEFGASFSPTDEEGDPLHIFSVRDVREMLRFFKRI
jgi:hypothetical protein